MLTAIKGEKCGFVGNAFIGLSFIDDIRPHEQQIEFWDNSVTPESVKPNTSVWERGKLHNAANLYHIQQRQITCDRLRKYRVAWIAGCVLYDRLKLLDVGGMLPSGVYHQELPTIISDRSVDAPQILPIEL